MAKSEYLQIRVSPEQKAALRHAAREAGLGMSALVLTRCLPRPKARFQELVRALAGRERPAYVLAALNDLLTELTPAELEVTVADLPRVDLGQYLANYLAAMVERAADLKAVAAPDWTREVEPLEEPRFVPSVAGLRLHLLRRAPVPFRRRNIFIDSSVGDRV